MQKQFYEGRYVANSDGTIYSNVTKRVLRPAKNSAGYLCVGLYDGSKPKRQKMFLVHRLIAEVFLGKSDLCVNHKNGNKMDNRIENLEWVTTSENNKHSREVLGNRFVGQKHGRAKLTNENVLDIRKSLLPASDLAKVYGVSWKTIKYIQTRRTWKHLN